MINGPCVQPCELTKWEGKKSIWNLYEWKPLASFLFKPSPNPLVKTVFMAKGALSQHLSTSPFRLLKMFFFKTCHMSSETNGVFTVNWTHLLSGFGQLCDSPGRHHQLWRSKTSEDFWLANFSKKKSLRSSWKNWAKFFFVTVVLFWLLVFWDSRSCVVRVNATTCGSVCSHLARLHVRNSVNQLPYRTDGHGCSGNWGTIRESDYLRILDANHLIASFLQGPWQLFDFYRTT